MPIGYKARRGWALVVLLIGLPVWIVAAVTVVGWLNRPPFLLELAVYVGLGLLWALPFKALFRGIGQPDPASAKTGPDKPD